MQPTQAPRRNRPTPLELVPHIRIYAPASPRSQGKVPPAYVFVPQPLVTGASPPATAAALRHTQRSHQDLLAHLEAGEPPPYTATDLLSGAPRPRWLAGANDAPQGVTQALHWVMAVSSFGLGASYLLGHDCRLYGIVLGVSCVLRGTLK